MVKKQYDKAIERFQTLLPRWVDDYDVTPNLMQAYSNYRHNACLVISECYEEMHDYNNALKYARLARKRYPYRSWCLTCMMDANKQVYERVSRIEKRLAASKVD